MSLFTQFTGSVQDLANAAAQDPTLGDYAVKRYDFFSSTNFTVPDSGNYLIIAVGAGGSGGAVRVTPNPVFSRATGGAAGGTCIKLVSLTASDVYSIVIGAGGLGVSTPSVGNPGGNTTVIGTNVSLTASGGEGGAADSLAIGGTASGGDLNYTGGNGGSITISTIGRSGATGGGAPGLNGTGGHGGDVTSSTSTGTYTGGGSAFANAPDDSAFGAPGVAPNRAGLSSNNVVFFGGVAGSAVVSSFLASDYVNLINESSMYGLKTVQPAGDGGSAISGGGAGTGEGLLIQGSPRPINGLVGGGSAGAGIPNTAVVYGVGIGGGSGGAATPGCCPFTAQGGNGAVYFFLMG